MMMMLMMHSRSYSHFPSIVIGVFAFLSCFIFIENKYDDNSPFSLSPSSSSSSFSSLSPPTTLSVYVSVNAFDLGHHGDLTRDAMSKFGMSSDAIDVGVVSDWCIDWYAWLSKTAPVSQYQRLHFLALMNGRDVLSYYKQLAYNVRVTLENLFLNGGGATYSNIIVALNILGGSLHAIQDFYTHSNWAELHPRPNCNCLRFDTVAAYTEDELRTMNNTLFSARAVQFQGNLSEAQYPNEDGVHGSACKGLNHDSYVRPNWQDSYTFGYAASVEWVDSFRLWCGIHWTAVSTLTLTSTDRDALNGDRNAMYQAFKFARDPIIILGLGDGWWKGPDSGQAANFIVYYATIESGFVGTIVKNMRDNLVLRNISYRLYSNDELQPMPLDHTNDLSSSVWPVTRSYAAIRSDIAVIVRTMTVVIDTKKFIIDTPDAMAYITVRGQTLIENTQIDMATYSPAYWTTLKFIDATEINATIQYQLYDDNEGLITDTTPTLLDINPSSSYDDLQCTLTLATGRLTGGPACADIDATRAYQSESENVTLRGDLDSSTSNKYKARVTVFIGTRPMCTGPLASFINYHPLINESRAICAPFTFAPRRCSTSADDDALTSALQLWWVILLIIVGIILILWCCTCVCVRVSLLCFNCCSPCKCLCCVKQPPQGKNNKVAAAANDGDGDQHSSAIDMTNAS